MISLQGLGGKSLGTRLGLAMRIEDVEAVVATADSLWCQRWFPLEMTSE